MLLQTQLVNDNKIKEIGKSPDNIAHNLNNILSVILGHCNIIDEGVDSGRDQETHVKLIEEAARRAVELCQQMRPYGGNHPLIQARLDIWLLVDGVVRLLQSVTGKNVDFELEGKHEMLEIFGDSGQIQQVVMNLIIITIEAIGQQKGTVRVRINKATFSGDQSDCDFLGNAIQEGNYACLRVSSNSNGMDVEAEKIFFEPFPATHFNGRSLNIALVLGIIKSHNGALKLSNTPNVGIIFEVYLPLPDLVSTKSTENHFPALKKKDFFLLVDDEAASRVIGSSLLKAMGFSVMTAASGREALEIFHKHVNKIDLILLSLIQSDFASIDTYRLLRKISPELPIVICGCRSAETLMEKVKNDFYASTVQKPYNPAQLRNVFMKLLNGRG